MSALTGIVVVELAHEAGAFAGKLLADMGADVIVVEPPGGCPTREFPPFLNDEPGPERSLHWWHFNTSKRGVTLNLESEEGRTLFAKLVSAADVLLECEPVGRLASLGLDAEAIAARNPCLVHAAITAFGQKSERAADPVTDLTILAGGGPAWSCGYDDHSIPPIRGGGFQGYNIACHYAVLSILTALLYREASGEGQFIDVSQHAAANITTEMASYHWLVQQTTVQRQTGRHAMETLTMESQVRCADGRYVTTGVPPRTPAEFAKLVAWLDVLGVRDELPEAIFLEMGAKRDRIDLSMIGQDDEVTAIFGAGREALVFIASKIPAYEFFLGAQDAGVSVGIVYAPEEAFEDEHFVARGFPTELEHPELSRSFLYPGAPYRFEKSAWALRSRAPLLGEHNAAVYGAAGLSREEIQQLAQRGII